MLTPVKDKREVFSLELRKTIFEFLKIIVLALVAAILITTFIRPTLVKGYSMYPTIEPQSYLIVNKIPYLTGTPAHGDIVVFNSHTYTDDGQEKDLIKRVIGIEGDTIEVKDNVVYRNGVPLEEGYTNDGVTPGNMEPVTVSENCIFVMGDNRARSQDSRDPSIGEIQLEDVMGRVDLRLYPFDQIGLIGRE